MEARPTFTKLVALAGSFMSSASDSALATTAPADTSINHKLPEDATGYVVFDQSSSGTRQLMPEDASGYIMLQEDTSTPCTNVTGSPYEDPVGSTGEYLEPVQQYLEPAPGAETSTDQGPYDTLGQVLYDDEKVPADVSAVAEAKAPVTLPGAYDQFDESQLPGAYDQLDESQLHLLESPM